MPLKGSTMGNKHQFFVPPKKTRLSEEIYQQVKEAILSGLYKPGERLPSEKAFCETFKVGRAVIREALRSLENSGLIHIRMGSAGGVFVKNIDPSTLTNTFEGIVRLSKVSLDELTAARVAIETANFRMITDNLRDRDLRKLEQSIEEARQALETGVREPKNKDFHILLANISGNRLLMGIIESLIELETKFVYAHGYSYPRKKRFLEEHEQVLKLLKEGNHNEAVRVFERHIANSVNEFGLPATRTD